MWTILLSLCLAAIACAQDPRGTILGRVTDTSSAAIPNVEVRATNTATGVTAAARTNQAGNYNIPFLPPGTYTSAPSWPASRSIRVTESSFA